jgi:NhaC family Na+:H+ antiporter
VATTIVSCIGMNVVAADQYMAIVLPGKMYKAEFRRRNLEAKNLSRALEDSGTMTSALVPWNTCGAYMSATLGVATGAYLPFAFFNLLNPLISLFYGFTGISITRLEPGAGGEPDDAPGAAADVAPAGRASESAGAEAT